MALRLREGFAEYRGKYAPSGAYLVHPADENPIMNIVATVYDDGRCVIWGDAIEAKPFPSIQEAHVNAVEIGRESPWQEA